MSHVTYLKNLAARASSFFLTPMDKIHLDTSGLEKLNARLLEEFQKEQRPISNNPPTDFERRVMDKGYLLEMEHRRILDAMHKVWREDVDAIKRSDGDRIKANIITVRYLNALERPKNSFEQHGHYNIANSTDLVEKLFNDLIDQCQARIDKINKDITEADSATNHRTTLKNAEIFIKEISALYQAWNNLRLNRGGEGVDRLSMDRNFHECLTVCAAKQDMIEIEARPDFISTRESYNFMRNVFSKAIADLERATAHLKEPAQKETE